MDEIIVRPKYSRQMGTQRRKRREPDNELLSTVFAAKLLVAVIILSVLALCKAANTPTTNFIISKVKVVTTTNYDVNKYLTGVATALGLKSPKDNLASQEENNSNDLDSSLQDQELQPTITEQNSITNTVDKNTPVTTDTDNNSNGIQALYDPEIKEIAEKLSMITPIKGDIASTFGTRTDPLSGAEQFHSGIDIEANVGTSIEAALGGEVLESGSNPEYNNYIKIKHNDGIVTVYAHCSLLIAKVGEKVNQGDVIAKVGDTEGLDGADLHFEVWKDDKAVDPEKLLNYINQ